MGFHRIVLIAVVACAFVANSGVHARPPLNTVVFNVASNAGANALYIAIDRPELNSLTTTGAMRMFSSGGNSWTGKVAIQGSATGTNVHYKYTARTTSSGTHCTTGNGSMSGATLSTNIPLWNPGYVGKTIYYHTSWTNALILYRQGTNIFIDAPMTRIGSGRVAGEYRYQVTGIGEAGQPLEFVPHGRTAGGVEQWDNPASGGVNNNYYTSLDALFLQDGNIFNYLPPVTVSAPQVITVNNWASSYTGNGIPSRGGRIYLPRGYSQNTTKRYPVLYMHDGQNVFDPGGAFGSWSADAAATREITQGRMRETIIVAVNNSNSRMDEYGTPQDGFTGNYYMQYLVNNVRPNINSSYRTLTNRMDTGNMGSSLGGLISAYIGLSTNVFGLVGAISPSYWYGPNFRNYISSQPTKGCRIFQDAGTSEGTSMWDYFWPVYTYYLQDGYVLNDDLQIMIGCGEAHNEAAWAGRVDNAFRFLYNPWDEINSLETNVAPSPGTLQFVDPAYSLSETAASVRVFVNRLGGSSGAASINVFASNGTATAGSDYVATNATLNWTNNDESIRFFDITLNDDATYEGDEFLTARLSGVTGASLGSPTVATITIIENDPPPPEIIVTNPPTPIAVSEGTGTFDLQGTLNASNWTGIVWSNHLTGASGLIPSAANWTINDLPLGFGTNIISVRATNVVVIPITNASDSAANSVYSNGWIASDNGGTGFGTWLLYTSSTNDNENGRFIATDAAVNISTPAWGMYANNGNLSEAKRILTNTLAVGQSVHISKDNGFIDPGSGVGVAAQNTAGETLWEFFFNGGDQFYSISGGTTDVGWTSTGMDIAFTLSGTTSYSAKIFSYGSAPRVVAGNMNSSTNGDYAITRIRTWNYNAGGGSDYDVFFNNLTITTPNYVPLNTGVTVSITRQAAQFHDGIPLSWWNQYGIGTNSLAANDDDADGANNWEEYIADTIPNLAASVYSNRITTATGDQVFTLKAGPPTTNSRVYDVWFGADLMDGQWIPLHLNRPGANDGSAIFITVTNTGNSGNYRTGVKLP